MQQFIKLTSTKNKTCNILQEIQPFLNSVFRGILMSHPPSPPPHEMAPAAFKLQWNVLQRQNCKLQITDQLYCITVST